MESARLRLFNLLLLTFKSAEETCILLFIILFTWHGPTTAVGGWMCVWKYFRSYSNKLVVARHIIELWDGLSNTNHFTLWYWIVDPDGINWGSMAWMHNRLLLFLTNWDNRPWFHWIPWILTKIELRHLLFLPIWHIRFKCNFHTTHLVSCRHLAIQ